MPKDVLLDTPLICHITTTSPSIREPNRHPLSMNQCPASSSMSKAPVAMASSSDFNVIFEKALKEYVKKTKQNLTAHPLTTQLQGCDSPAAVVTILQAQIDQFRQSQSGDERLQRWLNPTIDVLYAFSATLGQGIGLVFSPAQVIFAGAGVLLLAAKNVEASQEVLIDIFERIENSLDDLRLIRRSHRRQR
ncbi:hypothetical protein EI94DRAFT_1785037 [Lactarius quietus]|nr:hypothetical protein EI94DRAFT_1785037 [Lactarius quietus]